MKFLSIASLALILLSTSAIATEICSVETPSDSFSKVSCTDHQFFLAIMKKLGQDSSNYSIYDPFFVAETIRIKQELLDNGYRRESCGSNTYLKH